MRATEEIIDIHGVVMEAFRSEGIEAPREAVSRRLEADAKGRVEALRRAGSG